MNNNMMNGGPTPLGNGNSNTGGINVADTINGVNDIIQQVDSQVESFVEGIVDNNIRSINQGMTQPGMGGYMNMTQESYAEMGLSPETMLNQGDIYNEVADADLVRRGRTLYRDIAHEGQDEMFSGSMTDYSNIPNEVYTGDNYTDRYETQQAAEELAEGMRSSGSKAGNIIVIIILFICGIFVLTTLLDSFSDNQDNIANSDVVNEAVNQIRGQGSSAENEIHNEIDKLSDPATETNTGDSNAGNASETDINENLSKKVENTKVVEEKKDTLYKDFRNKSFEDATADEVLGLINIEFENGIYTPKFGDSFLLNTKLHKLEIVGYENIKSVMCENVSYTTDENKDYCIVTAPNNTRWRIAFKDVNDKLKAKDYGKMTIYYYPSNILKDIVAVEAGEIIESYNDIGVIER